LQANNTSPGSLQLLALDKEAAQAVMIHLKSTSLENIQICCQPGKDCVSGALDLPSSVGTAGEITEVMWTELPLEKGLLLHPAAGVYWLLLSSCNATNPQKLHISISLHLINPFGHLSTEQYSLMLLYNWLIYLYGLLLILWLRQLWTYREFALLPQRWAIPVLLMCCLLEASMSWADLRTLNTEGRRTPALAGLSVVLNSCKGAYSRMLLLGLSTGLGLTHRFLSPILMRILLFGLAYFLCALGYSLVQYLVLSGATLKAGLMLAAFPMAILNTLCLVWVYLALKENKRVLEQAQDQRLQLFTRIEKVLGLIGILALGWLVVDGLLKATLESEDYRTEAWMVEGMWQVVFLAVLLPTLWLVQPTSNAGLLVYTEEAQPEEEEKKMDVELTAQESFSHAVYRQRGPHSFSIVD
jgi:hypothetical protein